MNAYDKPGLGLELLRYDILGEERFDSAFRYYIRNWAYKHPTPWDFFHAMENSSGEDLSWFWRGWFMNNWKIDQAVTGVDYIQYNPANGRNDHHSKPRKTSHACNRRNKEIGGKTGSVKLAGGNLAEGRRMEILLSFDAKNRKRDHRSGQDAAGYR